MIPPTHYTSTCTRSSGWESL